MTVRNEHPNADPRPLTGEPLALDLVNTVWAGDGELHDLLDTAAGHRAWLAQHELGGPVGGAARRNLVQARDAIRAVLETPGDARAAARLDRILAHGRLRLRVDAQGAREQVEVPAPWRAGWLAARDLLRLLAERGDRVRRCGNDECVLWFLDTSRAGTRRWCSMTGCGNRLKARRHYSRLRADLDS